MYVHRYIYIYIASIHACMIETYLTYLPSYLSPYIYTCTQTHAHARAHTHTHTNEYRAELHGHRMLAVECEILELLLLLTFCNGKLGFIH